MTTTSSFIVIEGRRHEGIGRVVADIDDDTVQVFLYESGRLIDVEKAAVLPCPVGVVVRDASVNDDVA